MSSLKEVILRERERERDRERQRETERERERLANARVFCLDGDVLP